jgi:hypothetical protein
LPDLIIKDHQTTVNFNRRYAAKKQRPYVIVTQG